MSSRVSGHVGGTSTDRLCDVGKGRGRGDMTALSTPTLEGVTQPGVSLTLSLKGPRAP